MPPPTGLSSWQALRRHAGRMRRARVAELFERDPERFEKFSLRLDDILFDYSKQLVTGRTMDLLFKLARQSRLERWRDRMFAGQRINVTENRAVLHVALRGLDGARFETDGRDVTGHVRRVLDRMNDFCGRVHSGLLSGVTGKRLQQVVNIGIGGSDLGPAMVSDALKPYWRPGMQGYFVSNIDGAQLAQVLERLDPERCLFVVVSKTFTTQETLANASAARRWLSSKLGEKAVGKHFVAVSAAVDRARKFGIRSENVFGFWDWVGGRYSVWSAVGLSVALLAGFENFEDFLRGARRVDEHFVSEPLETNIPAVMALLGIWNTNFLGAETHAVLPYSQQLARLPAYLQQAEMESNGKSTDREARCVVGYHTAPVVWGEPGTNGQHAFYQLLHQGTRLVPMDLIAFAETSYPIEDGRLHRMLMANFFAQGEAFLRGRGEKELVEQMKRDGMAAGQARRLARHKLVPGSRPCSSLLARRLDPATLGKLLALYEHKIFCQGIVWNINSFDQWGVELGKQLAGRIVPELEKPGPVEGHDPSTRGLLNHYKRLRGEL